MNYRYWYGTGKYIVPVIHCRNCIINFITDKKLPIKSEFLKCLNADSENKRYRYR